jgi:4-diphosphocytidyl-2-C-methyl-D-erythritol kinase
VKRPVRLRVPAPAKVNLGLEVLGRRLDGYHDICTVLQSVSLFDVFEWTETGAPFVYAGLAGVPPGDDLVARALACAPDAARLTGTLRVLKRIPVSAGLGGGSTDAALALRLALPDASSAHLREQAARLGADVPFLLEGGTALAFGTGTTQEPLPPPRLWFVLVTPPLAIAGKTGTLYRGLEAGDFSDGEAVAALATRLRSGETVSSDLPELRNAFAEQLLSFPVVRYAYERLTQAGSATVSISGAGPTLYAVAQTWPEAARIAARLPRDVGLVQVARSLARLEDDRVRQMAAALRGAHVGAR